MKNFSAVIDNGKVLYAWGSSRIYWVVGWLLANIIVAIIAWFGVAWIKS
jgi:hypothetical protein